MVVEDWIKERKVRGHDIAIVILDRTTGEAILTTFSPTVVAAVQHAESATLISLKELPRKV